MAAGDDNRRISRDEIHRRAIARWENDGGTASDWQHAPNGTRKQASVLGAIGDAETVNIRVRLIAIENIIVALLAEAPDERLDLIREMAEFISPRAGMTPHRLTIEAAHNMLAIVERAEHYRRNSG